MSPASRVVAILLVCALVGCGEDGAGSRDHGTHADTSTAHIATLGERTPPPDMAGCAECHGAQVEAYLGHGMSASLGPLDHLPRGDVTEPVSGARYAFIEGDEVVDMDARTRDGGLRSQRVVGRLGAGVHDVSYVGSERHTTGEPMGRLAFLPLEFVTGHGVALSPFEQFSPGTGFAMPVNGACLRCHTTDDVSALPGAARDRLADPRELRGLGGDRPETQVWPGAHLGAEALLQLSPLGCRACHGAVSEHERLQRAALDAGVAGDDLGLTRLGELSAAAQRDICARCHLQGDLVLELAPTPRGGPQPVDAVGRRAVLVPAEPDDDFRFVGQLERLALSACFDGARERMTCTTCHEPHASVASQGTASFDARCMTCHEPEACVRPDDLRVADVTGEAARSDDGCVDCHVRRSQPFDLAHLRTADHFVRRRIPAPDTSPARELSSRDGALRVFHDGRLDAALATDIGRRWQQGLVAFGLFKQGRLDEAAAVFDTWPAPGSAAAGTPTPRPDASPAAWLAPLARSADAHHVRGIVLEQLGRLDEARAAYTDALACDPSHPQARLNRAQLALDHGDLPAAMADVDLLVARYPLAAKPWNLRAQAAARTGDVQAAASALFESARLWPSDPAVWHELGRLFQRLGAVPEARRALEEVRRLQPSRAGLAEDLAAVGG